MRHKKKGRKLSLKTNQRKALKKSLARSFVLHGKIKTTEAKAKELRSYVEKMITSAKAGTLSRRREAAAAIGPEGAKKLFDEIAPRYSERKGGYTRISKLPPRFTDGSRMAIIELV